jgi:hypothetical protein
MSYKPTLYSSVTLQKAAYCMHSNGLGPPEAVCFHQMHVQITLTAAVITALANHITCTAVHHAAVMLSDVGSVNEATIGCQHM